MKRLDQDKISLVEFLRSIKFAHENSPASDAGLECPTHFANLKQSARGGCESSPEDFQLIRSAN
jgi:hypothetical protein